MRHKYAMAWIKRQMCTGIRKAMRPPTIPKICVFSSLHDKEFDPDRKDSYKTSILFYEKQEVKPAFWILNFLC